MFYCFQFEDATWRLSRLTGSRLYPTSGEARKLIDGVYHTRADGYRALERLRQLTKEAPEQFATLKTF
jgi:hypothetical protein